MDYRDRYIKYKNEDVKIGVIENLYYTSFRKYEKAYKEGLLSHLDETLSPKAYIRPNTGFRFRFPFPDEDKLSFGEIGYFPRDRGVTVMISPEEKNDNLNIRLKNITGKDSSLEIIQQKLVNRTSDGKLCLALVVRNPDSGLYLQIEDNLEVKRIVKSIIHNHLVKAADSQERIFYRQMAARIIEGYRLGKRVNKIREQSSLKLSHPKRRRRRGSSLG